MRSIFSRAKYDQLKKFLDTNAKFLGKDDKDVHFFIFPDKLLKVSNEVSGKKAKITLKLNKIGKGSDFEEMEIPIERKYVKKFINFFKLLGFKKYMRSFQKRLNYFYKGAEIALKYSEIWGYHAELEIMVKNKSEKSAAERKIRKIAKELGLKLMSDNELKKFTKKKEEIYGARI